MAGPDAVAAVGLTLQRLLQDRVEHPSGNGTVVPVTLGPPGPDRDTDGGAETPRLNVFLYHVTENAYLKNQEIPGHGHPGTYGHPPLSLVLHFLLTVFGSSANGEFFDETPAHRLLGSAMRVLHDHAVLFPRLVTRRPPAGVPVLEPGLQDERERVKLTLRPLGLEDLSNLWTALALSYRLSVAYEASVVQIDSHRPRHLPQPVQELPGAGPRVFVTTVRRPELASVGVRRAGDPPGSERATPYARVGDVLIVRGRNLGAGGLVVRLGALELPPGAVDLDGGRLEATVPDDRLPDSRPIAPEDRLQPGVMAVEVAAAVPELSHVAVGSGRAAFVLVPEVASAAVSGRALTVSGTRLLARALPGQVVVGDVVIDGADYLPASDSEQLAVMLPDSLPAWPAAARVSGPLDPFPDVSGQFDLALTIGGEGPHTATLAGTPASLAEAEALLQAAIRAAAPAHGFAAARVATGGQALVIVPGGLTAAVSVEPGALADALRLSPPQGSDRELYLSGALEPFPRLTSTAPVLDVTIAGIRRRVTLASVPATLPVAAAALEATIRDADPSAAFAACRVMVVGDQLGALPGAAGDMAFAAASGVDETSVAELRLAADYPVRVRVGGVESIDERTVGLPG